MVFNSLRQHPLDEDSSPLKFPIWKSLMLPKEFSVCSSQHLKIEPTSQSPWTDRSQILINTSWQTQMSFMWTNTPTHPMPPHPCHPIQQLKNFHFTNSAQVQAFPHFYSLLLPLKHLVAFAQMEVQFSSSWTLFPITIFYHWLKGIFTTVISVQLCLSLVAFFLEYILDILIGLILEVDVALSRVTVSRKRSAGRRRIPTDQEMVQEKCGSDEGIGGDTFYRKTITNTSNIWVLS